MAKRKTSSVTFNKQAFLLPKMEVTEFGFYVRELGGRALLELKEMASTYGDVSLEGVEGLAIVARIVVRGTCDKDGHPVFTDEDIPMLEDKPEVLGELLPKILKLSGMPDGFGGVADNLKNAQPDFSTTELPTNSVSL